jgi:hypothetical protein
MTRLGTALRAVTMCALALAYACSDSTQPKQNGDSTGNSNNNTPTTGKLTIWSDYAGSISVAVDRNPVGTTSPTSVAPVCGQSGTLTVSVAGGSHSITGTDGGRDWSGTTSVSVGGCTLYKLEGAQAPTTGQLSIWTDNANPIAVLVDGSPVGTTSTRFATAPTCGATGTITITLPAGTHTVAGTSGSSTWSTTATVTAGRCALQQLAAQTSGGTTGQLSIWTDYSSQIAVSIDGGFAGTLTSYFSSTTPTCGQSGTLTLTVPIGGHAIGGVSGATTWNGTATVAAGQCTLFKLSAPAGGGGSTGQLSIWTDYATQIAVKVDGSPVGTTTSYFTGQPACGQSGTITIALPAGAHAVSGVSGQTTWNGTATVVAGQCTLFKLSAPTAAPTGRLSVWTDYQNQIAVKIDGSSVGTTTSYFPNGPPTCGQSGTITVTVPPGAHSVTGASGATTWSGTATVIAGDCTLFKLNAPTGGGGGGGNSDAQLAIWTNNPTQVAAKVDGSSVGTLTSYFPTGTPTCGQNGTITLSRTPGVHTITATAGTLVWNGTVTLVSGQCLLYELRAP